LIPGNPVEAASEKPPSSITLRTLGITLIVILLDQITKIVVLNTMDRGESIRILGDWLRFTFTENPGMALGPAYTAAQAAASAGGGNP